MNYQQLSQLARRQCPNDVRSPLPAGAPAMRLLALVELGRIEVLPPHGANRTRHIAITRVHKWLGEAS
jgi:hypothetical protein